jgi:hypothetical protein
MNARAKKELKEPARLDGAALDYAPQNEYGVVFLFATLARRFGLRVQQVQAGFPDCNAVERATGKKIRIEFEYKSRNFREHKHDPKKCDCIVCWIHDWPDAPANLRVIELRREFGFGFNVWMMPTKGQYREEISQFRLGMWSVPSQCHPGDLVLYYRTRPDGLIQDIFKVTAPVKHCRAGWKPGKDYMASIRRVCALKAPVHLEDFRLHSVLKSANFVRGHFQGRPKVTTYWPYLYNLILERNPPLKSKLRGYAPEKVLR